MLRWILALLLVLSGSSASPVMAAKRLALIIGNSAYEHTTALENPVNDAKAVAAALDAIGFDEVHIRTDLDQRALLKALKEFSTKSVGADTAVIYFAGHGVEVDNRNYLIPTDATLAAASDVEFEAVPLDSVRTSVAGATKLRLVILDACRNNPFKMASEGSGRNVGRGLAKVEPSANEIVAFAAREGTIAADGEGANSPFAAALVKHLATPGLEINVLFRRVRDDVLTATGKRQEPFTYGTLGAEEVFLHPNQPTTAEPDPGTNLTGEPGSNERELNQCSAAEVHWRSTEAIGTRVALEDHIKRFPTCAFADLAREKLLVLRKQHDDAEAERAATEKARSDELESRRKTAPDLFASDALNDLESYVKGFREGAYSFPWDSDGYEIARQLGFGRLFASSYNELLEWVKKEVDKRGPISIDELQTRMDNLLSDEKFIAELALKQERHFASIAYIRALQLGEIGFSNPETTGTSASAALKSLIDIYPNLNLQPDDAMFSLMLEQCNKFARERMAEPGGVSISQIIGELRVAIIRSAGSKPRAEN
jgi:hypothetical protein